jgi:hypothetical protein
MFIKLLIFIPLGIFSTQFQVPEESLFVSPTLGDIRLYHSHAGFHVHHEGTKYTVDPKRVDPMLRKVTNRELRVILEHYYIAVTKQHNKFYVMPRISLSRL